MSGKLGTTEYMSVTWWPIIWYLPNACWDCFQFPTALNRIDNGGIDGEMDGTSFYWVKIAE